MCLRPSKTNLVAASARRSKMKGNMIFALFSMQSQWGTFCGASELPIQLCNSSFHTPVEVWLAMLPSRPEVASSFIPAMF
jgi:hypothetical protein